MALEIKTDSAGSADEEERARLQEQTAAMNEALILSSVRQHELKQTAQTLIGQLQAEIAEREKAQAALRESEERYRTLFELGPVAVYSCDVSGEIRDFNRTAVELWGREPKPGDTNERFCGSFKMHRPDGRFMPHEQCPMAEVLCGKIPEVRDGEMHIERPDGSRITVLLNIRPLKDERGEISGAINCFIDITERERAERARTILATIVESSEDAITSNDLDGIVTSWNRGAEGLFGYTAREMIGQPATMLIPADLVDEEAGILERIRRGESIENYETLRRRKDGVSLDISLTVSPVADARGLIVGASKIARDVTRRKLMEAALRESEKKYRALFDSIDEGFCIIEKVEGAAGEPVDFRYVEANAAFETQSGVGGVVGKTIRQMFAGITGDWYETYATILATGEPIRFERELATDGRMLELYAFRVEDETHRRVAVIFKDITERRRAESKLSAAMVVAQKANRAKSDFLANMSHELRTPLNGILGFAQLLETGTPPPTPSQKRSIDQILKAGWYLLDLINEILNLAQIESEQLILSSEPVPLAEVMLECLAIVETQAQKRSIGMTFPRFAIPCHVKADRIRVKQVLVNLLSNAIKYNRPDGTVTVDVALSPPESVRINVRDTGAGLTSERLGQLFQPFNRLGKEAGGEEGTGIGLVVSKRLVEMMGGTIGAHSTVGVGSVFWIELHLSAAPHAVQEAGHAAPARPQLPDGTLLRTLLYVEDNLANLELVEQLIARRSELRLLSAADANLGIEYARAQQPAVILMDINLPGISGIEALKILRADASTAHIPIIALSANAMARDIEEALEAGFFNYITKPIKVDQFMDALDMALAFARTESGRATGVKPATRRWPGR